jgi:hypothetical protein
MQRSLLAAHDDALTGTSPARPELLRSGSTEAVSFGAAKSACAPDRSSAVPRRAISEATVSPDLIALYKAFGGGGCSDSR